jgi:hypothetical protein
MPKTNKEVQRLKDSKQNFGSEDFGISGKETEMYGGGAIYRGVGHFGS